MTPGGGHVVVTPRTGCPTLKVAYVFGGIFRKASVFEYLNEFCSKAGFGLEFYEVDVLVGGSEHDVMDVETQEPWIARIESGEFDCVILSPPSGSWSRANWANNDGPQPCSDRSHRWGLPGQRRQEQRRADNGNKYILFAIRAIHSTRSAVTDNGKVFVLLEHPEGLGRTYRGEPASIWQLDEIRTAFGNAFFWCFAGHQCQFPSVGRAKPTRLHSNVEGLIQFGYPGCRPLIRRAIAVGLCHHRAVITTSRR